MGKLISKFQNVPMDPWPASILAKAHLTEGSQAKSWRGTGGMFPRSNCVISRISSGNQKWLAGKSTMNGGFNRKITCKWSIFQHAMFDKRRGTGSKMFQVTQLATRNPGE